MSTDRSVERDDGTGIVIGWALLSALVRAVVVEMSSELIKHRDGVAFVVDQPPVGALRSHTSHEPLRIAIRPRRLRLGLNRFDAIGGERRVERRGVIGVLITNEEPEPSDPVAKLHRRLRAACVVQAAVGCAVTPRM